MKKTVYWLTALALSGVLCLSTGCNGALRNPSGEEGDPSQDETGKSATVLDRAEELAENVEKLPMASAVMGGEEDAGTANLSESSVSAVKSSLSSVLASSADDGGELDLTEPGSDYLDFPAFESYYNQLWSAIDSSIYGYRETKGRAVDCVRQLDTWVENPDYGERYRLHYDLNSDTLTIDTVSHSGQDYVYTQIVSSYDAEGRAVILANTAGNNAYYEPLIDRIGYSVSLYYVEGQLWRCATVERQTSSDDSESVFRYLIEADLASEDQRITQLLCQENIYEGVSYLSDFTATAQFRKDGMPVVLNVRNQGEEQPYFENYIYTAEGYNFYQWENHGGIETASVPLYQTVGWDKVVYSAEEGLRLTIGDEVYSSLQLYPLEGGLYWILSEITCGISGEPAIRIEPNGYCGIAQARTAVMEDCGLSYQAGFPDWADELSDNYLPILQEWQAFGITDLVSVDADLFQALFSSYNNADGITLEGIVAMWNEEFIAMDEQTEDNELYEMIQVAISGEIVLDGEKGVIDLSALRAEVGKSALLEADAEYSLNVVLKGDFGVIDLASVNAVYADEDFVIEGFDSVSAQELLREINGDYTIQVFFGKNTDGKTRRMSKLYSVGCSGDMIALTDTETAETEDGILEYTYTLTITAGEKGATVHGSVDVTDQKSDTGNSAALA